MLINKNLKEIFTLEDFILIKIVVIFTFFFPGLISKGADLGCILKSGKYILDNFSVFVPNIFLFPGVNATWVDDNWLSDVFFSIIYFLGSYKLLIITSAIFAAIAFTLVFREMMIKFPNWLINIPLMLIGLTAASNYIETNNRLFSYVFTVLFIHLLDRFLEKGFEKKIVAAFVLITIIWANTGTDFIFGLAVVCIYALAFLFRYLISKNKGLMKTCSNLVIVFLICLVASLFNPNHFNLLYMVYDYFASGLYTYNGNLSPPNFHIKYPFFFFELLILMTVFLACFSTCKLSLQKVLLALFFLFISLYSAINIIFFVIVILPLLSEVIANIKINIKIDFISNILKKTTIQNGPFKPIIAIIFIVFLIFISYVIPGFQKYIVKFPSFPVNAVKFLAKQDIKDDLFNPLGWGCYLSNRLSCKVFIDERMYQNKVSVLKDYNIIFNIYKAYDKTLEENGIKYVLITPDSRLAATLDMNKNWKKVYSDKISSVYQRIEKDEQ